MTRVPCPTPPDTLLNIWRLPGQIDDGREWADWLLKKAEEQQEEDGNE
ncbi:hypothetical protein [Xenorhabdus stockiae]